MDKEDAAGSDGVRINLGTRDYPYNNRKYSMIANKDHKAVYGQLTKANAEEQIQGRVVYWIISNYNISKEFATQSPEPGFNLTKDIIEIGDWPMSKLEPPGHLQLIGTSLLLSGHSQHKMLDIPGENWQRACRKSTATSPFCVTQ